MKTRLAMKICAGLILGSVLSTIPVASAEYTMYDDIKALHQRGMSSGDMYDAMEPTSAGPQGPVRTDMMKYEDRYSATRSAGYREGAPYSQWDELKNYLGPIGGEGTN